MSVGSCLATARCVDRQLNRLLLLLLVLLLQTEMPQDIHHRYQLLDC